MMIHTGEFGPFAHCFSGICTALADIAAQRAGQPLCTFLSGLAVKSVPVYASTPDVRRLDAAMRDILEAGHSGTKLMIGLGLATDLALLKRCANWRARACTSWPMQAKTGQYRRRSTR